VTRIGQYTPLHLRQPRRQAAVVSGDVKAGGHASRPTTTTVASRRSRNSSRRSGSDAVDHVAARSTATMRLARNRSGARPPLMLAAADTRRTRRSAAPRARRRRDGFKTRTDCDIATSRSWIARRRNLQKKVLDDPLGAKGQQATPRPRCRRRRSVKRELIEWQDPAARRAPAGGPAAAARGRGGNPTTPAQRGQQLQTPKRSIRRCRRKGGHRHDGASDTQRARDISRRSRAVDGRRADFDQNRIRAMRTARLLMASSTAVDLAMCLIERGRPTSTSRQPVTVHAVGGRGPTR